ncbi:MAG: P-loop NTPase [candidate division WOR-3 bacterium]
MDPRFNIIDERLKEVKRIIGITGGKGGVGKSSVASLMALLFKDLGKEVGLLDLDFSSPALHIILGFEDVFPKEEKGIIPPIVKGIKFMSIVYFVGDNPLPLRGEDFSNVLIELMAITRWEKLDYLFIDMPPGIGDLMLDVIRVIKNIEFVMVGNQSKLSFETLRKVLLVCEKLSKKVIGLIENINLPKVSYEENKLNLLKIPFLGRINFDKEYEECFGDPEKLLSTNFAKDLRKIINMSLLKNSSKLGI